MSTATVEQFQKDPASLLAAVERGEEFEIARGQRVIARLLPAATNQGNDSMREEWVRGAIQNLGRAYGPNEPDYDTSLIIEPNPSYRP